MVDPVAEEAYRALAASMGHTPPGDDESAPARTEVLAAQQAHLPVDMSAPRSVWNPMHDDTEAEEVAAGGEAGHEVSHRRHIGRRPATGIVTPAAESVSKYHTLLPRLMVVAALIAGLGSPLLLGVLERQGHLQIDGRTLTFDDRGRSVVIAAIAAIVACSVLGWLWWTVAAALNARKKARYSVSPLVAPSALAVIIGCGFAFVRVTEQAVTTDAAETKRFFLASAVVIVAVVAHFGTLTAYRRTAGAIGASTAPWSVVIVLPWVVLGLNLLAQFFVNAVGDSFLTVSAIINLGFIGVQVLAIHQAMTSFDRACVGRQMSHSDRAELPSFMRVAR